MTYSLDAARTVRAALSGRQGVTEKQMFGGIAFLLHGNMCVGVHGDDLIVRVRPAETDALLREPGTKVFDLSGRPMKGWLLVTPAGFRTEAALQAWIARGLAYASSLPKKTAHAKARPRRPSAK